MEHRVYKETSITVTVHKLTISEIQEIVLFIGSSLVLILKNESVFRARSLTV